MNNVSLIGRLVRDPSVKTTDSGKSMCTFTIAIDRERRAGEEKKTDFIPCVTFDKTAEIAGEYLNKGSQVGVIGRIQTGSYEKKDGTKVYTTDILVRRVRLLDPKKRDEDVPDGFHEYQDEDDNIPF